MTVSDLMICVQMLIRKRMHTAHVAYTVAPLGHGYTSAAALLPRKLSSGSNPCGPQAESAGGACVGHAVLPPSSSCA